MEYEKRTASKKLAERSLRNEAQIEKQMRRDNKLTRVPQCQGSAQGPLRQPANSGEDDKMKVIGETYIHVRFLDASKHSGADRDLHRVDNDVLCVRCAVHAPNLSMLF